MYPVIFQSEYFTLNTIWIFIGLGIITGVYSIIKFSLKNGLKLQFLSENSWKLFLFTLIGARLVNILLNFTTYFYEFSIQNFLQIFYIWDKGFNLWGGLLAFLFSFYYICKESDQDFFKWLDVLTPSAIILLAISHLGEFFEGIAYGKPTSLPWGVNFENFQIKYTVPIHPTQIYAFLYAASIAFALIILSKTKRIATLQKAGFVGLSGIFAYNLFRLLEEFVRGDDVFEIFGIRSTTIISLLSIIIAGVILYLRYNTTAKKLKLKFIKHGNNQKHR
ncbi:prolipoprotein diacylglyceryl transferase [Candidatus Peregrinibacteria bacterium]|nr:prolipoprotein diacylglyceryl transferase [Candidatus Peregrinibacteria bacterium]